MSKLAPEKTNYTLSADNLPPEVTEAFAERLANQPSNPDGPLSYRWVFNPTTGGVELAHNEGPNHEVEHHDDLARRHEHPHRVHGYAHRIVGGWRVTDWHDKPVEDPFVLKRVLATIKKREHGEHEDPPVEPQPVKSARFHYGRALG